MRLLGIDYGNKRVGVALSDEEGSMAFPHGIIENNKHLIKNVAGLIKKEGVDQVIIGHSINYEGFDNPIMVRARVFAEELKEQTRIPVIFEPEVLTTVEARRIQGSHTQIDASAAALILNSFIERHTHGIHND